jgi:hypothetical protein
VNLSPAHAKRMHFQTQDGENFFDENQHGIEGFMVIHAD